MPKSNDALRRQRADDMPMVTREARVEAIADEEGGQGKIRLIWTAGGKVRRYDWLRDRAYEEELSLDPKHIRLDRLNSGNAPLLDSHNSWGLDGVLGVIEAGSVRKGKDGWELDARMDDGPETAAIRRKVANGIIRNVSVGYRVYKFRMIEEEGKVPTYRAEDWEPVEVSLVAVPADAGAHLRADQRDKTRTNPCIFITNRKDDTMPKKVNAADDNDLDDTEVTETPQARSAKAKATRAADPEPTPEPTSEPTQTEEQIRAAAVKEERKRCEDIQSRVRAAGLDEKFAATLIKGGKSVREASDAIFAELEKKQQKEQGPIRSHVSTFGCEGDRDLFLRGAGDWLIQKAGLSRSVEAHTKEKVTPGEFRGMTLLDLARECLERQGVNTRGMSKLELAGTAFSTRSAITQSTSDFSVLLENTLHKVLLAAYATTPDTWTRFCATGSVSDFRAHNRYRKGTFGTLDTVNENGEFKNKAIPDGEKESITATTKGNIINISRQTIINDDMGAFNGLATDFGRAAKLSVEVDVYALLAQNAGLGPTMNDGVTLFHADHNNITTSAALTAANIDLDRVAMGSQRDPSGNEYLDLRPAVILLALSLGSTARTINDSQYDPDTVANKSQMKPNAVRGLFRDIVDTPRISGNRRYLFADPAIAPVIEVAFLDGQQEPFLDSQEGFRVDGTEWKVRLDYAVGGVDFRGAVTNAGG